MHIVLDELQSGAGPYDLEPEVASALAETGLVTVLPTHEGLWIIRPAGSVGAVQIGDLLVEVKPKRKVGLNRLLFLLGYARDSGFRPDELAGVDDVGLFAALGESLARTGERALRRGALNGYVHVEDSLRMVRGRIRVGDQMSRRPGMMLPLEVSFDDFTPDTPENRILRAAVWRMMHLPRLSKDVGKRLAHLHGKLDGVSELRFGAPLPHWSRNRSNEHYVPALRLAEIILQNMSAEAGPGRQIVASFVVNMASVFEDFVATALREALTLYSGETFTQYQTYLDEEAGGKKRDRIRMYVDVLHSVGRRPAIVFDAKYKAASSAGAYPNADHYQMLAYCTALNVSTAWLVYADGQAKRSRRVRNSGISIVEFPVDLSQEPEALLASVAMLARQAYSDWMERTP